MRYRGGIAGRLRGGPAILTEFRENTLLGGHRRQECLSCHREAVGIPGILPRVEGRCASKSTIVLNSCFLMDSRNRHSLLESLKTIVGRNEQQFIPFAIRSSSPGSGRSPENNMCRFHRCLRNYRFSYPFFPHFYLQQIRFIRLPISIESTKIE